MKLRNDHTVLMQCDGQDSVLANSGGALRAYGCFGWSAGGAGAQMAFSGVLQEAGGGYLLGNGYRVYSPALRRFGSPDSISPFGEGGINPYVYCLGDPVNSIDPDGRAPIAFFFMPFKKIGKAVLKFTRRSHSISEVGTRRGSSMAVGFAPALPSRKGATVMDALNDVDAWKKLRGEAITLKFDLKGADANLPKTQKLLARQAEVNASFKGQFPGYSLESGLRIGTTSGRTMDTIVMDEMFAGRVLVQELDRIKSLPRTARLIRSKSI